MIEAKEFSAGADALSEAIALKPDDYEANYWRGLALSRARKFAEAIPSLEKVNALRPDSLPIKTMLAGSYLSVGQFNKAFHLFPELAVGLGLILIAIYLSDFAALGG